MDQNLCFWYGSSICGCFAGSKERCLRRHPWDLTVWKSRHRENFPWGFRRLKWWCWVVATRLWNQHLKCLRHPRILQKAEERGQIEPIWSFCLVGKILQKFSEAGCKVEKEISGRRLGSKTLTSGNAGICSPRLAFFDTHMSVANNGIRVRYRRYSERNAFENIKNRVHAQKDKIYERSHIWSISKTYRFLWHKLWRVRSRLAFIFNFDPPKRKYCPKWE